MQLSQLFNWYKTTRAYLVLKPNAKRSYDYLINEALTHLGDIEITGIDALKADQLYTSLLQINVARASLVIKVLRKVWNVAIRFNHIYHNPFSSMGVITPDARTTVWTEEQVNLFILGANDIGYPSIGLLADLCYGLCQRPGDMRKLTTRNYVGHTMSFTQEKTGKVMKVYVPAPLREHIESFTRVSSYLCTSEDTATGYNERDYTRIVNKVKDHMKLPTELLLSDLRRTGLTEGSEHDTTDAEAMAVSGHDTRSMLNVYQVPTIKLSRAFATKRYGQRA